MKTVLLCLAACVVTFLPGCASKSQNASTHRTELRRLGHHKFEITTHSPQCQEAFNRGLTLAYGFSHHAAELEFRRALEFDPTCAMASWGIALVNGPHINFPIVPPAKAAVAWEALNRAKAVAGSTTPLEQKLIDALSARYAQSQPEDRSSLDQNYAAAMRAVWQAYPGNADVATLFAESAMDLHPWNLWTEKGPQEWTPEILMTLERALQIDPEHPGANHLYIHAIEASPNPEKGGTAADRLGKLVPDSSHLVHMPAHIYARIDRWNDAAESNRKAMKADSLYRSVYPRPGFYAMYMAHNAHFLAFVAMMQGNSKEALRCARLMVDAVPEQFLKDYAPVADGYMVFVSEVLMRFGRWNEVLQAPQPPPGLPLSLALWHFTRATALTALDRIEEAKAEQTRFKTASEAVPADWTFGNNLATNILAIASLVLDGETAAQSRQFDKAISALRQAAELEDKLRYDEPPDWIQPVRHTLGAVLLRANRTLEAEKVYHEDLQRFPGNGWSLLGLRDALRRQDLDSQASIVDARFRKAWAKADIKPTTTCYCQETASLAKD